MAITLKQLVAIMLAPELRCRLYLPHLVWGMGRYEIMTLPRMACFMATIGHESASLKHAVEIWGPTPAQDRYEGRADLGNTQDGDGSKYRGRGLIQITGRTNYAEASHALGVDLVHDPAQLAEPNFAAISACWWWQAHGCNSLADAGDMQAVTRRVNGGLNGLADRMAYYARAVDALRPDFTDVESGSATTAPSN
jgi:putative chitinase